MSGGTRRAETWKYVVKHVIPLRLKAGTLAQDKKKHNDKKYSEENKHILLETIQCDCGGKYAYKNKARHFQTKQHQQYLQSMN